MSRAWPWLALACSAAVAALYTMWGLFGESDSPGEVPMWLCFGWLAKGYWDEVRGLIREDKS